MIAGEYAVLEPNMKAVVVAVNRYVTAHISLCSENRLSLPQMGLDDISWKVCSEGVKFSIKDSRLKFIENSISVTRQFLNEKSISFVPFELKVTSELDDADTGKKYGLGSSAAVAVAVISAILYLHCGGKEYPELDDIFKLSAVSHLKTQRSGSGADIAAAVYGGWIEYSAYSTEWVLNELEKGEKLVDILKKPWQNLSIRLLIPPSSFQLAVGWTKESASTGEMIKKVKIFREKNLKSYNEFLEESSVAVTKLIQSFEDGNLNEAIKAIKQNRKALLKLGETAGIDIETAKLKTLCSIAETYGGSKPSGAGGGDCGIALLKEETERIKLYNAWEEADIMPLDLSPAKRGVTILPYSQFRKL